jgi:hypothetical protein
MDYSSIRNKIDVAQADEFVKLGWWAVDRATVVVVLEVV